MLALIYAELGATYPVAGGTARFAYCSHGPVAGFLSGWASWLQAVSIAPVEVIAALTYCRRSTGSTSTSIWSASVGIAERPRPGRRRRRDGRFHRLEPGRRQIPGREQLRIVIWKTLVPILTVVVIVFLSFHGANFHTGAHQGSGGGFAPVGIHGIFAALPAGVVFALQGFEQAVQLAGEAYNPKKDISRAILCAMAIGAAIYIALEIVFIGAINPSNLRAAGPTRWAAPARATTAPGTPWPWRSGRAGWGRSSSSTRSISPGGTGLVYLGTTARISYAIGNEPEMPSSLRRPTSAACPCVAISSPRSSADPCLRSVQELVGHRVASSPTRQQ